MPYLDELKPTLGTERLSCRIDAELGTYSVYNIRRNIFAIESSALAIMPPPSSGSPPLFLGQDLKLNFEKCAFERTRVVLQYDHPTFPFSAVAEFATIPEDPSALTVRVAFVNRSENGVRIHAFYPLWIHPTREGSVDLGGSWSYASMLINGQNSWSESKIELFSKPDGTVYESHGYTLIYNRVSGQGMLVGFETMQLQFGRVVLSPRTDGILLQAESDADDVSVRAGATLRSESLLIRIGDPPLMQFDAYVKRVCELNHLPAITAPSISGWTTEGVEKEGKIDQETILSNLTWLEQNRKSLPIDNVLIHEGWETKKGDWLTIDQDRFPSGLSSLASRISEDGFVPGLHISPFLVDIHADVLDQLRSYLLKDQNNSLVRTSAQYTGSDCYVLDCTNPAALEWLGTQFLTICGEWGFKLLHLDHLHFASLPAHHKDSHASRTDAYRKGIQAIRKAAGPDVTILASSAPLTPSAGLVDYWRTGPEMVATWQDGGEGGLKIPGRNNLMRSMARGRWWNADTGPIALHELPLTEGEEQILDTLGAVCSDTRFFRGDLSELTPTDLDHARFLIGGVSPTVSYVPNLMERDHVPNSYVVSFGNRHLVALFDWDEGDEQISFSIESLGVQKWDSFVIYDVWGHKFEDASVCEQYIARNVHPHSCRLLHFVPTPKDDVPVLIGSTLHYTQGGQEITRWERGLGSLDIDLDTERWIGRSAAITLYRRGPKPIAIHSATGADQITLHSEDVTGGQAITIELNEISEGIIKLSLTI